MEKRQEVNTWLTVLVDPANSKNSLVFKAAAVDGQKAIITNATNKDLYVRGDSAANVALAAAPATDGATPVEGLHIPAGKERVYNLDKGMTQLSLIPYGGAAATGLVSVKVGNGI